MKEDIIVLKESTGKFGTSPEERTTEELLNYGIINIDKPKGPTSHQVSDYVKKILQIKKAGHSGTLDPAVTGVLPIALGRATRIVQFLLKAPKEYVGIMHIHKDVDEKILLETVKKFIGRIKQLPPIKSAVKRATRTREIYEFEIIEIKNKDVLFRVKCQAGTYIRKLCVDVGKELGTGAHMTELRRISAGPFDESTIITLQDLKDAITLWKNEKNDTFLRSLILPPEKGVKLLPKIWILDSTIESMTHGRDLAIPGISKLNHFNIGETVAVMSLKGELVAVGRSNMHTGNISKNKKGIVLQTEKVFMNPITQQQK